MSDLQCPAKVLLVAAEMLGASVPALERTHYAGVFVVPGVAGNVGELASYPVEIIDDAVDGASLARAVEELADVYRGYTIVVVATRAMIRDVLGERASASAKPVVIAIDSSGWVVL
jgi:hypothetical protein